MNFRRKLARKLTIVVPVVVMAALMIALVAIPAGALTQVPAQPGGGEVLNSPVPLPAMLNYQGYLTDSGGNPINNTLKMTFSIYNAAIGTKPPLWTETHPSVSVTDGLFNVLLGSVSPINISHLTGVSYLGIKVGSDPEMTPRQRIVSVAYAFRSGVANWATNAGKLDDLDSTHFVAVAGDTMTGILNLPADGLVAGGNQLVLTGGKVGIGTTTPGDYQLNVQGGSNDGIYASGNNYGVYGISTTGTIGQLGRYDYGVWGFGSGTPTGVLGGNENSGNYGALGTYGEGVYGRHGSTGNKGRLRTSTEGVSGKSTSGNGVYASGGNWDFYAAHGQGGYGPFTGGHEVKLAAGFPQDIRPGLIVSVTGETQVRTDQGEITFSSTLPTVQLSNSPNDKKVFGVIISESPLPKEHWYEAGEGERFGIVNALGEGRVWVTNINGDIEAGDYITTSAIAGYGQKQDDDLLHSYTLGKAIETIDWSKVTETVEFNGHTYKVYAIAVVYTSG